MSHVTVIAVELKDLDALKAVCAALGLEFRENQKTYRWYGRHVGDFPIPEGLTKADLGGFVARVKEAVTDLRQTVAQLQDGFRDDLAGAHRAWHGTCPASRPAPTILKASFRADEPSDELTPKAKKKKR